MHEIVCVGGKAAGKRIKMLIDPPLTWRVPIFSKIAISKALMVDSFEVEFEDYTLRQFRTQHGHITLYGQAKLDDLDVQRELLAHYHP